MCRSSNKQENVSETGSYKPSKFVKENKLNKVNIREYNLFRHLYLNQRHVAQTISLNRSTTIGAHEFTPGF